MVLSGAIATLRFAKHLLGELPIVFEDLELRLEVAFDRNIVP